MSVIGQAVVEVRPDTRKFTAGIRDSLHSAARLAAGAFAATGAFDFFKGAVEGAVSAEESTRRFTQALQNLGKNTAATRDSTNAYLASLRDTSGFTKGQLRDSLTKAVTGLGDVKKAQEQVTLAAEIARGRNMDLARAQQLVARVQAGGAATLRRLGINFQATTPHVDALKKKIAELTAQEGGADKATKEHIKSEIAALKAHADRAKALDKLSASTQAITLLQKRFGGSIKDFSETAAGHLAHLKNDFQTLQVAVGNALLPALESLTVAGEHLVDWLKGLGPTLSSIAGVVGPVAGAFKDLAEAIGAGPIIGALVAFKSISIVLGLVQGLTASYTATVARLAEAQGVEAGAATAMAEANGAVAAAAMGEQLVLAGVTAETVAMGAAAGEATASIGIMDVALAGLGGPIGVAVIGIAALVGGLLWLSGQESALSSATHGAADAFRDLGAAIAQTRKDSEPAAAAADRLAVSQAKLGVATAKLQERRANAAVKNSTLDKGSDQYKQLVLDAKAAALGVRQAEGSLTQAQSQRHSDWLQRQRDHAAEQAANAKTISSIGKLAAASRARTSIPVFGRAGINPRAGLPGVDQAKTIEQFSKALDKLRSGASKDESGALLQHNIDLLKEYTTRVGKIPTPKAIKAIVDNRDAKVSLDDLAAHIAAVPKKAKPHEVGVNIGQSLGQGVAAGIAAAPFSQALVQQLMDAKQAGNDAMKIGSPSRVMAEEIGKPMAQGVALGITENKKLISAALTTGLQDTISQAKQGLAGLAGGLSQQIGSLLDATVAQGPEGKALRAAQRTQAALDFAQQLKDAQTAVRATAAGTQARAKAEADLAVLVAQRNSDLAQQRVDDEKQANDRTLADLSDALNRGLISQKQYTAKVAALLKSEGVSYRKAGEVLGLAFADGFQASLRDLLGQAGKIGRLNLGGSGLGGNLVDPVKVLRDQVLQARQAVESDRSSKSGGAQLAKDERMLRELERLLRAVKSVSVDTLNVYAGTNADAKKIAGDLLSELAAAAR